MAIDRTNQCRDLTANDLALAHRIAQAFPLESSLEETESAEQEAPVQVLEHFQRMRESGGALRLAGAAGLMPDPDVAAAPAQQEDTRHG